MRLTAAYYRSSTKLQEDSVATQQYNISQYALKNGILIDTEYPEPHTSARKSKLQDRPKMNQLITDIRKNKIGKLLVYKRDRLARKVEEHLEIYHLLKRQNVEVHFIADNEPPMRFDVFGELTELFIAVMNQREGEQITSRIIDTKMNNFLQGKSIGNLPYGYSKDEVKEEIKKNDEELEKVKLIFEKWNTGAYKNYQALADELNEAGILRGEKQWDGGNINDILNNSMYMGVRAAKFGDKTVTSSVKKLAIIEKEVFVRAQQIIEERKKPRKKREKFRYLLEDLIHCQICKEERIHVEKDTVEKEHSINTALILHQRSKKGEKYATYECKKHSLIYSQEEIEKHVFEKAREFFNNLLKTNFKMLYSDYLKKELKKLDALEQRYIKKLEHAEDTLVNATSRWITNDTEQRKNKCLEAAEEVKEWKSKLHDLDSKRYKFIEVPQFVGEIKKDFLKEQRWRQLKFDHKKELLKDLVHEINVDEISIHIVFKHPLLESNEVTI